MPPLQQHNRGHVDLVDLKTAIGMGVVSLDNMTEATLWSESAWNSAISCCEQVILAKETIKY